MNNKYNEINKQRYHLLKEYPINCPICSKELNLATIIKHCNFGKNVK